MANGIRAPFPYFGGKALIAAAIWARLGAIFNFIEPFFGSGAILFARPGFWSGYETVNDRDGLLTNFWRATRYEPGLVARIACDLVNEVDLVARARLLCETRPLVASLMADPHYYDPKLAGWWLYGQVYAIARYSIDPRARAYMPRARRIISLEEMIARLEALRERLQYVRILCGDWSRLVNSKTNINRGGWTGFVFDPPYSLDTERASGLYANDDARNDVAVDVRRRAIELAELPLTRVVLCGYFAEHDAYIPENWERLRWHARGGFASLGKGGGRQRATQETVWFSPKCVEAREEESRPLTNDASSSEAA